MDSYQKSILSPQDVMPLKWHESSEVDETNSTSSSSHSLFMNEQPLTDLSLSIFSKYPYTSTVTKLNSTLEIKQTWLYSEWDSKCQFSKYIQPSFPFRNALDPSNKQPDISLIQSVFHNVRGNFSLWGSSREEGRWRKVIVTELDINWIMSNVEILYPSEDRFSVSELNGIVLWKEQPVNGKRYKLYEGNHRISTWLANGEPNTLPATIFIGKPKK